MKKIFINVSDPQAQSRPIKISYELPIAEDINETVSYVHDLISQSYWTVYKNKCLYYVTIKADVLPIS